MYLYYDPYVLCHYGVKGMKWGVRKSYNDYRKDKYMKKYERKNAKDEKRLNSLLSRREKNRAKIEAKYDRKKYRLTRNLNPEFKKDMEKSVDYERKAKLTDFDNGTNMIKKGAYVASRDRNDLFKQKANAVGNKGYKRSDAYRDAYKRRVNAKSIDIYGKSYTDLLYASQYANGVPYYTKKRS